MDPMAELLTSGTSLNPNSTSSQIKDALKTANGNAQKLENLNAALRIIAFGTVALVPSGTTYAPQTIALDAGLATTFLCFMTRSDRPGLVYAVPYLEVTGAIGSLQARLNAGAYVFQGGIQVHAEAATDYVSPPTLTFYYYMIAQPANSQA